MFSSCLRRMVHEHIVCTSTTAVIAAVLITGCGKAKPTATPAPPTDTSVPPTATMAPSTTTPTDTPAPSDTIAPSADTSVPPTVTPRPTATSPSPPNHNSGGGTTFTSAVPPVSASLGDTWIRPDDGTVMVYVPGGDFLMGSSDAEIEAELSFCRQNYSVCHQRFYTSESPQHAVTLDGFWMDQTEVTNGQFVAFLNEYGNTGKNKATLVILDQGYCRIRQVDDAYQVSSRSADHPVVMVSWYGADAYCKWVGARLPTEAEWEYAARGPEGSIYPWGNDAPTRELTQFASGTTAPIGSHPDGASWCGVHDLAGNVWEWTRDWYGHYPSGAQENPTGPPSGRLRVIRGGGWHSPQREVRSAFRLHDTAPSGYNG